MTPEDKKIWVQQEEARLMTYQHQHRGLGFLKLLLPPTTDRKVNLVGFDNHIYRGSIPRIPEDQLPPEVDQKSIDEETLYKEIRDMDFPPVFENEPLGPSRRIGGSYTLAKKMILAPVQVDCSTSEETLILGRDGGFYKGTAKYTSTVELDKQLSSTKRPIKKMKQASSLGFVEPTLVTLHIDSKLPSYSRHQKPLIKLPIENVGKMVELIKNQNTEERVKIKESITGNEMKDLKDMAESEQSEGSIQEDEAESEQTEQSGESEKSASEETDKETEESKDSD